MTVFVIIMIGAFIAGLALVLDGILCDSDGEFCVGFILFLIGFILLVFMFFGDHKCNQEPWQYSEYPYKVEKISSLNDNNMVNGRFYLRSGYIDENLYYQYMTQLNNGGFVANKVKADNTTLFYDTDNYRVEWWKKERNWLFFEQEVVYNKIYIPEGSITESYTVDLE